MPSRETAVQRGRRLALDVQHRIGYQIRTEPYEAGLSQRELGRRIRVSHQTIGRIERGAGRGPDLELLVLVAAALGMTMSVSLHPSGSPVRDAAQLALLDRLRPRLGPGLRLRVEVPMPVPGDLRSADGLILGLTFDAMLEAETHVGDVQAVVRRARAKRRDLGPGRLILLLSDTRHHRQLLRLYPELLDEFPISMRVGLRALAKGEDPGGDMIVLL